MDGLMGVPLKILVVDDDRDSADSLALILKYSGYAAETAYNAAAALQLANETRPALVFIDAAMPRTTGFELAKQLRNTPGTADSVLVCLTGYAGKQYERQAREAGCDHFLVKPGNIGDVLRIVRQVADKDRGASDGSAPKPEG